jgi:hypothetical protein
MLMLTGQVLAVADNPREYNGERWTERVLHLLDGVHSMQITLLRANNGRPAFDESALPDKGETVTLEVWSRGGGNKRVYYTAVRVLTEQDVAEALGLVAVA